MFGSGKKKAEALTKKMDQLISKETDIRCLLQREEIQPWKKRKREVDNWLARVEIKKQAVNIFVERIKSASLCDFMMSLATETEIMIKEVEELLDQGSSFTRELVLDDPKQFRGVQLIAPTLKDRSSRMILEEIQDYLFREDVLRVGIYGVGGVGKTSLALHINNHILTNVSPFDHVYWITVGRETSLYKMQRDISKAVGFDLSDFDDERIRASHLFTTLTKRKQCLIILDDIWENISMDDIGVPIDKGVCKVVITTRNQLVCDAMLCKKIKVSPLPVEEAWDLFVDQLTSYDALSDATKEIAQLVAEECDGLPLGIKVMARCMRGVEDIHKWRDTLKNLRESTSPFPEMQNEVFRVLHFSYTHLKDEKLQKCYLFCALYPEDHRIEVAHLIDYFRVEELVDITGTFSEQMDQCSTMLSRLHRACLLEHYLDFYKMHDLVRDMAVGIMKETGAIIKAGMHIKKIPSDDFWTSGLTKITLMKNNITSIEPLTPPNCPNLTILLLQDNPLRSILESFFVHMSSLKILNLSRTQIESLPDSISLLRNLGALILRFCTKLKHIPSLEKLENMLELVLRGSKNIEELPEGMKTMGKLRLLDLGGCNSIGRFPIGLLSKHLNLEYLAVPMTLKMDPNELVMLKHLKRFEGHFFHLNDFNRYMKCKHFDQLEHYGILVGDVTWPIHEFKVAYHWTYDSTWVFGGSKSVKLVFSPITRSPCEGPFLLPHNIVDLEIVEYRNCVHCRPQGQESLGLNYLPKCFFELQHNTPSCVFFKNLQCVSVTGCSRVDVLFPLDLLEHHLPSLRRIFVEDCSEMKEIFTTLGGNHGQCKGGSNHVIRDNTITFLNLEGIYLSSLPSLTFISKETIVCNSLNRVDIFRCGKLMSIPISIRSVGRKAFFFGDRSWWDSCEWNDPLTKQKFLVV